MVKKIIYKYLQYGEMVVFLVVVEKRINFPALIVVYKKLRQIWLVYVYTYSSSINPKLSFQNLKYVLLNEIH